MPERAKQTKSPWGLRLFTWTGSGFFSLLLIWLLGFMLSDVGRFRVVDRSEFEDRYISAELRQREEALEDEIRDLEREIEAAGERRDYLRDSVATEQRTMNQLMDLQGRSLDEGVALSAAQQAVMSNAQQSFFTRQSEYSQVIENLLGLRARRRDVDGRLTELQDEIGELRESSWAEYSVEKEKRDMQAALLKILLLLPVILLAAWLFLKKRSGAFAPLVYATGLAVLYRLIVVIHDYFPSRYYKYIFLVTAIAVVLKILLSLIRSAVAPHARVLIKRYREAYDRSQCPFCAYPILRGSAEDVHAAKRVGGKKLAITLKPARGDAQPYTCPACSQTLFEACGACGKVRHALLPSCMHCGDERTAETQVEPQAT